MLLRTLPTNKVLRATIKQVRYGRVTYLDEHGTERSIRTEFILSAIPA
jgi:hypothetical protein